MKPKITPQEVAEVILQDWLSTPPGRSAPNRTGEYLARFFPGRAVGGLLAAIREASRMGLIEDTAWRANHRNWEPSKTYLALCLKAERMAFERLKLELPLALGARHEPAEAA